MHHPTTVLKREVVGRACAIALTACAATSTIAAQEQTLSSAASARLRQFVASIPSTIPAEYTADLLLRAADSERADAEGHDWLVATYERAFSLASDAPAALGRRMLPWAHAETREAIASAGYEHGLDTTSLQARAVRGLLRVEPRRALALLEQIRFLIPALSCSETLMYDVSAPYRALTAVARHFHHSPFGAKDAEGTRDSHPRCDGFSGRVARVRRVQSTSRHSPVDAPVRIGQIRHS